MTLNLIPTFRFGAVDLAEYPFSVEFGSDRGSPEAVVASVSSALRDGALSRITRYDNRTVTLTILVDGTDLADLSDNEATLVAEVLKERNEFTFNAGDGFAADSVYDTFATQLTQQFDDELERNMVRRFILTFEAAPYPRSTGSVTTQALAAPPASPTTVTIDDATSAAAWGIVSGPSQTAWASSGGAVRSVVAYDRITWTPSFYTVVRRSGSVNMSTTRYLQVDWSSTSPPGGPAYAAQLFASEPAGVTFERVAEQALSPGVYRTWFETPGGTYTGFDLGFSASRPRSNTELSVLDLSRTDTITGFGSRRQSSRVIEPGGSRPTEGTIYVQHATAGLGQTIVYTHPAVGGYNPPLRKWKSAGATDTVDTALVSGFYTAMNPTLKFSVPWSAIPTGDTQLWARMYRNTAATVRFSWAAYASFPGFASAVGNSQSGFTDVTFPGGAWVLVPLGRFVSPPTKLGSTGQLRIDIAAPDAVPVLDEAWLFAMDEGVLTVVDNFTGTAVLGGAANRLRIAAPSLDAPFGEMMCGYAADWSDSHTPSSGNVPCDQVHHRFHPDGTMVFTATSGATDPAVSFEHYPRWHSNAGF